MVISKTVLSSDDSSRIAQNTSLDQSNSLSDNYVSDEFTKKPCKELTWVRFCEDCGKWHLKTHTCNERFARCCFPERRKRNYARLIEKTILSKRLIHIVIGFKKRKVPNLSKENKRIMEKALSKLHNKIRKKLNFKFNGIRIFDLADDGCYEHYHYAILPEKAMMNKRSLEIDVKLFRKILSKVTKGKSEVVKVLGYRSKRALFSYFSKRTVGKYGHSKHTFFLEDVMTYAEYHKDFFNVRSLVKIGFPEGISCINAQSQPKCPYCNSTNLHTVDIIPSNIKYKPPDWLLRLQELVVNPETRRCSDCVEGYDLLSECIKIEKIKHD